MTKKVLFYARYSTDLQHEVSIETQVELGKEMVANRGWNLIDIFEDRAISGTSYKLRRGIQALLRRVAQGDIDIVLCVTVDRLSRDMEHSARILKELRYRDADIWTVHAGAPVTDLEMALRAALSHELVEQIRYRTREGMKTAVRKGKSAGGLAYGYRIRLEYDAAGERIRGLRNIDEAEAEIIVWIFEQYASGRTPLQIAVDLNSRSIPGPRGAKWRDTAIRGHRRRGTGILNNEAYIGRVVWNRREYRKHPDSEKRLARHNDQDQWVVAEQPQLRIVSDDLWAAVKRRQAEVDQAFAKTHTNKLARSHRPQYLLSGRLECGHCFGPYAIMAKDRYGCTNRQKKLPIDHLGGIVCTNSKTISRAELEKRVVAAIPDNLLGADNVERLNREMAASIGQRQIKASAEPARLEAEIKALEVKQRALGETIVERMMAGHQKIPALDAKLDELEKQRLALQERLEQLPPGVTSGGTPPVINSSMLQAAIRALKQARLSYTGDRGSQVWIDFMRRIISKVVVEPSADGKSADLAIHGHLAAIMAAQEAWQQASRELREQHSAEFVRKRAAGEFKTVQEKVKYLNRCQAILAEKEADWLRLQVSVVAGAGFEPAAFRL